MKRGKPQSDQFKVKCANCHHYRELTCGMRCALDPTPREVNEDYACSHFVAEIDPYIQILTHADFYSVELDDLCTTQMWDYHMKKAGMPAEQRRKIKQILPLMFDKMRDYIWQAAPTVYFGEFLKETIDVRERTQ